MIVGGRDQIHTGTRMSSRRDLLGHFAGWQMTTFTGLCSLTDFDLNQICGIDRFGCDPEATGCNLNAAVEWILAKQLGDFSTLAVDRKHIEPEGCLCISPVGNLALGTEGHRRDQKR